MTKVSVDFNNLRETQKKMQVVINELRKELLKTNEMIEESKKDFDTPLATKLRTKSKELIDNEIGIINQKILPYVNKLDNASKIYENAYNEMKMSITGEKL